MPTIAKDLETIRTIDKILWEHRNPVELKIEAGKVVVIEITRKMRYKENDPRGSTA